MRVVMVEDNRLLLDAVAESLRSRSIDVVARAVNLDEALVVVNETACDAAILDVSLPPNFSDEGIRVAEEVRRRYPDVGLLVLSGVKEVAYVERLLNLEEHARSVGYLLKDRVGDMDELAAALTRVTAGEVVIDSHIIERLMSRRRRQDPLDALSPHERRVLSLVAEGRSNLGIAQQLNVKISTVEKHLSAITSRLGLLDIDGRDRREVNVRVLATLEFLRRSGTAAVPEPQRRQTSR